VAEEAVKKWYLVYTKPRQESVARTNLTRQGYEIYLPLTREQRRRRGRRTTVVAPLFPRYLFIHLDRQTDNWGPIRSTLGVVSLVKFAHAPSPVPDDLILALYAREGADGMLPPAAPLLRRGSRVRILDGSLAGYEGIFLASSGRDRVVILLDIMGKHARTLVAADAVEPSG
jgi:transcriptional antiterminator RfaH